MSAEKNPKPAGSMGGYGSPAGKIDLPRELPSVEKATQETRLTGIRRNLIDVAGSYDLPTIIIRGSIFSEEVIRILCHRAVVGSVAQGMLPGVVD